MKDKTTSNARNGHSKKTVRIEYDQKSVYLSLKEATKKWTGRIPGWGEIYSQLSIYFEGRI